MRKIMRAAMSCDSQAVKEGLGLEGICRFDTRSI